MLTKDIGPEEELKSAFGKMLEFQRTHNSLTKDFEALYRIAESKPNEGDINDTLVRSAARN